MSAGCTPLLKMLEINACANTQSTPTSSARPALAARERPCSEVKETPVSPRDVES